VGLLLGLVVVGPGLAGGSLLSLDLLVTPEIPVPSGMFGLGPALSQRVPLFALVGGLSAVVGGPVATKVLLVAWMAAGFAGAARLVRLVAPRGITAPGPGALALAQAAAGTLWAVGPFALTRVGVGHVNLVWVIAVLPWALPRLCRPDEHLPSTFLASLALAIGGPGGGTLGLGVAAVALLVRRGPRLARTALAIALPHLVWVLPTIVLLWAGAGVDGAGEFSTRAGGPAGWAQVAAGGGFWRADVQAGAEGWLGALAGLAIAALAAVGSVDVVRRCGRRSWPAVASLAAAIGLALAVASAVPGVRDAYDALSRLPFGAPLRESQRFLALWLVWAAPASALGALQLGARLAPGAAPGRSHPSGRPAIGRSLPAAALLALVVATSIGGWWGIEGRLEPVEYPSSWARVRQELRERPGTAVALPWSEYPTLSFAGGRQAFNPLPQYLGGDVISSYDPRFDPDEPRQEQVDPRARAIDDLVADLRAAEGASAPPPVGARLAELGVRWVVLAHEEAWRDYGALASDPGLRRALALPDLDLYEVVAWPGEAVDAAGDPVGVRRPVPPLLLVDGAGPGTVVHVAGAPGWVQGWATPVAVTDAGLLRLTGHGTTFWFWPAAVLLVVDLALVAGAIWALSSRRGSFGRILAPGASARLGSPQRSQASGLP
jgi:hypothetical protein